MAIKKSELKKELHELLDRADDELLKKFYMVAKKHGQGKELYRLIYSSARKENCTTEDIYQILEASRKNNPKLNITGMLIHTEKRFLQILEGPFDKIQGLYDKLKKDKRHTGSVLRYCEPAATRLFPDWNMAYKNADTDGVQYLSTLTPEKKAAYQKIMEGTSDDYSEQSLTVLKSFIKYSP